MMVGKGFGLPLRCLYNNDRFCTGMGLLVLPLAGESRQFPDWNRGVTLPLRDLVLTMVHSPALVVHLCAHLFAADCFSEWRRSPQKVRSRAG